MQIQSLSYQSNFRPASAQSPAPRSQSSGDSFESGQDDLRFIFKHTACGAAIGGIGLGAAVGIGAGLVAGAAGLSLGGAVGAGLLASLPAGIYGGIGGAILGTGVGMVRLILRES
ncbi:MAG: hypothetical protein AMXMBFR33_06940 [Candidatus Xenobia bacterium]